MQPQGAQDTTHGWFSTATERGGHGSSALASAHTPVQRWGRREHTLFQRKKNVDPPLASEEPYVGRCWAWLHTNLPASKLSRCLTLKRSASHPSGQSFYSEVFHLPWELSSNAPSAGCSLRHLYPHPSPPPLLQGCHLLTQSPSPGWLPTLNLLAAASCHHQPQEEARKTPLDFRGCAMRDYKLRSLLWDTANKNYAKHTAKTHCN